jgi:hypothetical protein
MEQGTFEAEQGIQTEKQGIIWWIRVSVIKIFGTTEPVS